MRWGLPFFVAAALAAGAVGLLGALAERTIYRPLYRKGELAQALLTFGLCFVAIAVLTMIYGTKIESLPLPGFLAGLVDLGYRKYPAYRLFLIALGLGLAATHWVVIDGSLYGARLRAAVDNPRMAGAVGEVDHAHQPHRDREAHGNDEQHHAVGQAIQQQRQDQHRGSSSPLCAAYSG